MRRLWRKRVDAAADVAAELAVSRLLVECRDETSSVSTALDGVMLPTRGRLLLRHLMFLPPQTVEQVRERLGGDGYVPAPALPEEPAAPAGLVAVALARGLRIDSEGTAQRSVAQELAVVSSMTARAGGRFGTWAVLATLAE